MTSEPLNDRGRQDDPECQPGRELKGGTALVNEACHARIIGRSGRFHEPWLGDGSETPIAGFFEGVGGYG